MSFLANRLNTYTNNTLTHCADLHSYLENRFFMVSILLAYGCGYFVRTNMYLVENQSLQAGWLSF